MNSLVISVYAYSQLGGTSSKGYLSSMQAMKGGKEAIGREEGILLLGGL